MEDLLEAYAAADGVAEDILSDKQEVSAYTSTAHHCLSLSSRANGENFKEGQGVHL